jgi:tetratricopeptide (TPR) repeat protein
MSGTSQHVEADPRRLLRRARRAHERGEPDKAAQSYAALLANDPGNFDALHGLGQIHLQSGRLEMALALFQSSLKSNPDRADGFSSLGLCFHLLRQFERALVSYDAGLRIEPRHLELLNRRGVARLELGQPHQALEDFDHVLEMQPGASAAREEKEAKVRERLKAGELGLDIYGMRDKLANRGLEYRERPTED